MPKKVDEIHQAILRDNPSTNESAAWAMAWAAYNKHSKKNKEKTKATKAAKRAFKNYSDE